eukprot:3334570-Alexandrium_andersonii.AAC.2
MLRFGASGAYGGYGASGHSTADTEHPRPTAPPQASWTRHGQPTKHPGRGQGNGVGRLGDR